MFQASSTVLDLAFTNVQRCPADRQPAPEVLYDVYHMQIMEGDLIATMEANLSEIGHIHVADVPGRHEPGTGEINYLNIARMLRTTGYDGCIGLECFPREHSDVAIDAFRTVFS